MKSYCSTCLRPTNQEVLKEESVNIHEEESGWWEENNYQIIRCKGCDAISFRKTYNDIAIQQFHEEDTTTQELYPKRGIHSRPIKAYRNVPIDIKKVYIETIEAYNTNLTLLSGVGVRAILEAICIEKGIKGGTFENSKGKVVTSKNLDGKIYGLASNGFLTVSNAEVLHELRFLGNAAVHELANPTIENLTVAIDIIELVLDSIYELTHKGKNLMRKRINNSPEK